jgi:hypothetical protein
MARYYETLKCGCLISEDGGGGLLPCAYHFDNNEQKPGDVLEEYFKKTREKKEKKE